MSPPHTLLTPRKLWRLAFVLIAFVNTALAKCAFAQRTSSIQLGVTTRAVLTRTSAANQAFQDTSSKHSRHTVLGALIGTGTGAAIGFYTAYRRTQGNYLDHTEDGLLYVLFSFYGAVIGLLLGGIVGYVWK